jgi:hypothetical protein
VSGKTHFKKLMVKTLRILILSETVFWPNFFWVHFVTKVGLHFWIRHKIPDILYSNQPFPFFDLRIQRLGIENPKKPKKSASPIVEVSACLQNYRYCRKKDRIIKK